MRKKKKEIKIENKNKREEKPFHCRGVDTGGGRERAV